MKKIFTFFLLAFSLAVHAQSLVISQVYGAGGNGGSVYKNDFIELFNPTGAAISIKNWSVQYNGVTSTATWQKTKLPDVSIQPGQYFLVAQAQGSGGTTDLPAPDVSGSILMSGTAGKVVLVSDTNAITLTCPTVNIIDKVGYGSTATCYEGSGPTPAFGSNTNSVIRNSAGCTDTDNNAADFTAAVVTPRNSASPFHSCGAVPPSLTATPSTLPDFGFITAGVSSESSSFDLAGNDLTGVPGVITISSPSADFEVSSDNLIWGSTTTVAYTGSSLMATPVYVRFSPQSSGDKSANISISGGGVSSPVTVAVTGGGLDAITPLITTSTLSSFGSLCVNTTGGPNTFNISGSNLTADSISVGPLSGYSFSTTTGGTYQAFLKLAQPGGNYTKDIFVKFTPVLLQSYNGNIPVTGGGVTGTVNVAATGEGTNTAPLLTTEAASRITANRATLAGLISDKGCTAITVYGFEYSTVSGFADGSGTVINSSNETTGNFSADITGLIPSTVYYYKVFAVNGGGKKYGEQRSLTTLVCAGPVNATGKAMSVTTNSAVLPGSITDIGCSAVTAYGVQYSGIRTFTGGLTTSVAGNNIASNSFTVTPTGLVQNTKYYYRSFATNTGGTSFGGTDSFTTSRIAPGLVIYSNPVQRGTSLHFSIDNLRNEYHAAQLINSIGQIVYQKNMTVQTGFIDEGFIIPAKLPAGIYVLKVLSISGLESNKRILIL